MDERVARTIHGIKSIEDLAQFERNARQRDALSIEIAEAIRLKSIELGRELVARRAGIKLENLTVAEERIVRAISEYAGVKKRNGNDANRTFLQVKNRGFIGAAETAVIKSKPTQGFQTLADEDLSDLSYEQIIVDHPEEFSSRARWYARRTLGLDNESDKPPAKDTAELNGRTATLLEWMKDRSEIQGGLLGEFTNADVAAILDMHDLSRSGRAFGNIQSRIDYACYLLGFPPLGLAATIPFDMAWAQGDRNWAFPLADMQLAAKSRRWLNEDFDAILAESRDLPGQAYMSWKQELSTNESKVRDWAFRLKNIEPTASILKSPTTARRNPAWTRDELILALDLYLRHRGSPPRKSSAQVLELSRRLASLASLSSAEIIGDTFRNANGVYMKMMNFMRIDPDYTKDGRVGLGSGSRLELPVWDEFAENPMALASAVKSILARIEHTEIVVDAPTVTKADLDHDLAGQRPEDMTVAALAALEEKFKNADPEVKERVSKYIERGAVGMLVKQHNGHKCQICDTLGVHPLGFKKQNGEHYVEAHHVMPVSLLTTGSLAASNVMTLCPNHHRQMHYGRASVTIEESIFVVEIDYRSIRIPRLFVDPEQPSAQSARPL